MEKHYQQFTPVFSDRTATRVRVLLVCDTDASGGISEGVEIDRQRMVQFFSEAFKGRETMVEVTQRTGSEVTAASILDYYRNLKSTSTETLVFYYAGHGGATKQGPQFEHFLALTHGNRLLRSELRKEMERKQHQCLILLTDCCSNSTTTDENQIKQLRDKLKDLLGNDDPIAMPSGCDRRTVDSLFLRHKGIIDLTAASPTRDQFAWTNSTYGGCFTYSLVRVLRSDVNAVNNGRGRKEGMVTWSQAFTPIQKGAAALSLGRQGMPPLDVLRKTAPRDRDRLWQWAHAFSFNSE